MSAKYSAERTYSYLKGMAMGLEWENVVRALAFAREAHKNQTRKNGEPYFIHPLTLASHAVALGVRDEAVIAACILHDVVEDCGISINDLPVSNEICEIVMLLTYMPAFTPEDNDCKENLLKQYYGEIRRNRKACLVKALDRCNNVSTMEEAFTPEKIRAYIQETRQHVLPLMRYARDKWPEDSSLYFILRYHIVSVIDGMNACLEAAFR